MGIDPDTRQRGRNNVIFDALACMRVALSLSADNPHRNNFAPEIRNPIWLVPPSERRLAAFASGSLS